MRSNWRIAAVDRCCDNALMARRRIYDDECHAQFVTFSCYRRRLLLDHVHAIVWFPAPGCLSAFMQVWNSRGSRQLKKFILYTEKKAKEKLDYMHLNPVRAGLVRQACDWRCSSARYFEQGKSVGCLWAGCSEILLLPRQHRRFCEQVEYDGKVLCAESSVPAAAVGAPLPANTAPSQDRSAANASYSSCSS